MHVIDLEGDEYVLQATSTNDGEVNGNQSFSATILPSKANRLFIDKISEMWLVVDHDGVEHKIIYVKRKGEGDRMTAEIKAIPLFFDALDNQRIERRVDEHMTAQAFFSFVFDEPDFSGNTSGFGFVLSDQFDAVGWEGLGEGETRLESFKRGLERYKAEFRIVGNTVYLEKQIGRDTQFMYRHRLNASNIVQEIDANELWTYAKGYGDYGDGDGGEDWQNANLVREYTSPMAKIIGIRHAPPIKNGNITTKTQMDAQLKTLVDDSLKISVSADIHDLRKQGYPLAQSQLGDRVFMIDERIGLNDEVRVISQTVTRDWRGNVIDIGITFGSEGLTKRHQSNIQTAVKDITNLLAGRKKLPYSVLDDAVKNATNALKNITSELTVPENGGLMAVDKNDPNKVVLFNAAGIGISNDGGATFDNSITGEGVVAETVIGENLIGLSLTSPGITGHFQVTGNFAEFYDGNNGRRVEISPSGLYGYNSNDSVRFQADSSLVTSAALGTSNYNVYLAAADSGSTAGEVRAVKYSTLGGGGNSTDYDYIDIRARSIKSAFGRHFYIGTDAGELRVMSQGLLNSGTYRDLRANKVFANEFEVNNGSVLYLRSNSRVRVMGLGSSNSYSDIEANRYIGNQFVNLDENRYLYMGSDNGVRVTSRGTTSNDPLVFRDIQARDFVERSSRKSKENIRKCTLNALSVIDSLEVKEFNLIGENIDKIGFIAEESQAITSDDDNEFISHSRLLTTLTKAVQELSEKVG